MENWPAGFAVYTGEDAQALTTKVLGGRVISVAAHNYAPQMRAMYDALSAGNKWPLSSTLVDPRMAALFCSRRLPGQGRFGGPGLATDHCRLPICDLTGEERSNWQPPWGYLATPWRVNYQPTGRTYQ